MLGIFTVTTNQSLYADKKRSPPTLASQLARGIEAIHKAIAASRHHDFVFPNIQSQINFFLFRVIDRNGAIASFQGGPGRNAVLLKVRNDLFGDFLQRGFGELRRIMRMHVELDKVGNIPVSRLLTKVVQKLHGRKVRVTHADNDDRQGRITDGFQATGRFVGIRHGTVRHNEQNGVRLRTDALGLFERRRGSGGGGLDYFSENCRSTHNQATAKHLAVGIEHTLDAFNFLSGPTLKAMTDNSAILGTKPKDRVLLIRIILRQYANNRCNGLLIIVAGRGIQMVKGTGLSGISVGARKIDRHHNVEFESAANVIDKVVSTTRGGCRRSVRLRRSRSGSRYTHGCHLLCHASRLLLSRHFGTTDDDSTRRFAFFGQLKGVARLGSSQQPIDGCFKGSHGNWFSLAFVIKNAHQDGSIQVATTQAAEFN
mmetsp:Transcript_9191/g.17535  ORF Transcript_9191/g.17535 Transcript_9191/m.17535 type:complete len:427 (+) Transcript_9191:29-1309(+)